MRCGTCMAVCPVYEVMRHEGGVARGKLNLVKALQQGRVSVGRRYRYFLTACLLCNRCRDSCPNQVDTAAVVQAARAELARRGRIGRLKRFVLRRLLPARRALPKLIKGARAGRILWAARIPEDSGLHIRFLRGPGDQRRRIPPVAKPFFLERLGPDKAPGKNAPADAFSMDRGAGLRVALFVGCINNYLRPQAAKAAVAVLRQLGLRLSIPPEQACCGLPAFGAGECEGATLLARRNLDAFAPAGADLPDAITSPCASCAYTLKNHLPELLANDEQRAERARLFAERVVPFSVLWSLLSETADEGPGRQARPGAVRITYHDPCHLSRGFGQKDAPRFLLTSLKGAQYVEMCHPCRCCGHGGSFNLAHYDLSCTLGADKSKRVRESGAEVVVTECSGCVLQLSEMLGRDGAHLEVVTTAEAAVRFGPPGQPTGSSDPDPPTGD